MLIVFVHPLVLASILFVWMFDILESPRVHHGHLAPRARHRCRRDSGGVLELKRCDSMAG